jgi:2'-hydroxyisoflavone reductase
MTNRREFLASAVAAGLAGLGGSAAAPLARSVDRTESRAGSLRILILGGTSFLGPHQIAYALGRGHAVTTFTRGRTRPSVHENLFDDVEQLVGDRAGDLAALRRDRWDVVIDNSGREVAWTRASATTLRDRADLYVYTSSTGVYYPYLGRDIGEDTELVREVPSGIDEIQAVEYGYGVMKANSEREAGLAFGEDRVIVVRPTYMMGPGDRTDRFTYWPVRLARGGEVLVPGRADDPVQYVDVRDVAGWMIRLAEEGSPGTLNAVGPSSPTGMHRFVHGAHAAFSSPAAFVAVTDYGFLEEHGVRDVVPWIMPVGDNVGSALVSNERALARGLSLTPLAESVRDIHEWWHSGAVSEERRARLASGDGSLMAREADLLAAWRARGP